MHNKNLALQPITFVSRAILSKVTFMILLIFCSGQMKVFLFWFWFNGDFALLRQGHWSNKRQFKRNMNYNFRIINLSSKSPLNFRPYGHWILWKNLKINYFMRVEVTHIFTAYAGELKTITTLTLSTYIHTRTKPKYY